MARAGEHYDGYLPIAEHGLVGDLHTVALVGTNGTIDWYCCPAFDSPSVFGSILDKNKGGFYALRPTRRRVDLQAALLPRHERADHALPDRGGRRRGPGLHADRPRRDGAAPPSPDAPRRRRARPDGLRDRGPAALRLRARRARGRDAPARRAVPLARPDARARGGDRADDGPRADGSSGATRASTRPSTSPRATRRRSCSSASRRTTSAGPTPSARRVAAFEATVAYWRRWVGAVALHRAAGARWCCAPR